MITSEPPGVEPGLHKRGRVLQGQTEIREAYGSTTVARDYIDARFVHPLGALLHSRQTALLLDAIETHRPQRVLEIAPGPARLTIEIARRFAGTGVMVDASAAMLAEATNRLKDARPWHAVRGDAFSLPVSSQFDLVYSFRLIRHFEVGDRGRLYREIGRVLNPGGVLIFDAINEVVAKPLRARSGPDEYQHFDAMLDVDELKRELLAAGFQVVRLVGVQKRLVVLQWLQIVLGPRSRRLTGVLMNVVERVPGGEPLEWVVVCRKV